MISSTLPAEKQRSIASLFAARYEVPSARRMNTVNSNKFINKCSLNDWTADEMAFTWLSGERA
jgi:hypothetical protein